jgi:hypothetical protein
MLPKLAAGPDRFSFGAGVTAADMLTDYSPASVAEVKNVWSSKDANGYNKHNDAFKGVQK